MKQTIDISPESVKPIAAAGIRFLNMETTLIPGNIKQQLAVLEVFLGGLGTGELVLATPHRVPVESNTKGEGEKLLGPAKREPSSAEREKLAAAAAILPGLPGAEEGEGQSG